MAYKRRALKSHRGTSGALRFFIAMTLVPRRTAAKVLKAGKLQQASGTLYLHNGSTAGGVAYGTAGGGDAVTTDTLDQFADVTQTAGKTLAITESTTLAGGTHSGTNTGDQTTIVAITGTKAQFDTACTDGNFLYTSDAATTYQPLNPLLTAASALGAGILPAF